MNCPLWPLTSTDLWNCQSYSDNHAKKYLENWISYTLISVTTHFDNFEWFIPKNDSDLLTSGDLDPGHSESSQLVPGLRPNIPLIFTKIWSVVFTNAANRQTDRHVRCKHNLLRRIMHTGWTAIYDNARSANGTDDHQIIYIFNSKKLLILQMQTGRPITEYNNVFSLEIKMKLYFLDISHCCQGHYVSGWFFVLLISKSWRENLVKYSG